jgi:hypothetical protein
MLNLILRNKFISKGLHRYLFMVFKQRHGKQDFADLPILSSASGKHREKFNTR